MTNCMNVHTRRLLKLFYLYLFDLCILKIDLLANMQVKLIVITVCILLIMNKNMVISA